MNLNNMKRQQSFINEKPTLYLVATPIGNLDEMTPRAIDILKNVDIIAAEDTRNTMKLLSKFDIHTKLISHHEHNQKESSVGLLNLLEQGKSVAIVSDAGYPLFSDPGQQVVELVIASGYNVVPISGANAMMNALVASGLSVQPVTFIGFLDTNQKESLQQLQEYKYLKHTLVLYEAPHRLSKTVKKCLDVLGNRKVCLARELTKKYEEFVRCTLEELLTVSDDLKGEMVLVIEGNQEETEIVVDFKDVTLLINHYIETGISTNEAIKRVAKEMGISKNEVYRQYHLEDKLC